MAETVAFELIAGAAPRFKYNSAGDIADFKEGDLIDSDLPLDTMWPAKFVKADRTDDLRPAVAKRRQRTQRRLATSRAQDARKVEETEEPAVTGVKSEEDEREDVTDQFAMAGDNDFKVTYVPKKGYTIHEGDKSVNDKPFRSSKEVEHHLEELTGSPHKKPTRTKK